MWTVFDWVPRTLFGFLTRVGGAHGVDLAGFALGQVLVLNEKVHCRSLSSINILYNHPPTALPKQSPEPWCGLADYTVKATRVADNLFLLSRTSH